MSSQAVVPAKPVLVAMQIVCQQLVGRLSAFFYLEPSYIMSWIQLRFTTERAVQQQLEDALLACGALSLTYQDAANQPILEPALNETPLWDELVMVALFEADISVPDMLQQCTGYYGGELPLCKIEILEDKDWVREWMDSYQPIQFGRRIWVCPSWLQPPEPAAVNIMLDPGLAFGAGTHPTTALCLEQLDGMDLSGSTVIDYGCGSGILAIAALLLGAEYVVAIDIDPQALQASRENARRNGIDDARLQLYLPHEKPAQPVDLVMANILAGPLVELAPEIMARLKPQGTLLLSGLLLDQKDALQAAYSGIDFESQTVREQWLCLQGTRRQA